MSSQKTVPSEVEQKILELKSLEIKLGNLPSETWTVTDLQKRAFENSFHTDAKSMSVKTETLFADICEELARHNFSHTEIADIINLHLKFERGPKYCSAQEVADTLT